MKPKRFLLVALIVVSGLSILIYNIFQMDGADIFITTVFAAIHLTCVFFLVRGLHTDKKSLKSQKAREVEFYTELLNDFSKMTNATLYIYDVETKTMNWERSIYKLLEVDESKTIDYETFISYVLDDEQYIIRQEIQDSVNDLREGNVRIQILTEKKRIKFVKIMFKHFFDRSGEHIRTIGIIKDISQQIVNDKNLSYLLETSVDGFHVVDEEGYLVNFSKSFAKNLGYEYEELNRAPISLWDDSVKTQSFQDFIQERMGSPSVINTKHKCKDGTYIDVQMKLQGIELNGKKYLYAWQRDISEYKEKEYLLEKKQLELEQVNHELEAGLLEIENAMKLYLAEKTKYKSILELASDGIFFMDMSGKLIEYSLKAKELLGYTDQEMNELTVKDWDKDVTDELWIGLVEEVRKKPLSIEREHTRKDGTTYPCHITAGVIKLGEDEYIYSSVRDITENRRLIETIKKQTYTDELTGIQNRKAYSEKLPELLAQLKRYDVPFCLMILDIDHFKSINDTYGHSVGDDVLKDLSQAIHRNIRKNDYIYRVGGEEFALLSLGIKLEEGRLLAEKIRKIVNEEVKTIDQVHISVSIGLVEATKDDTPDSIFVKADQCMYLAKESGRNQVVSQ